MEYGLYGDVGDKPKLDLIDTQQRAVALLDLLDSAIGTAVGSVAPYDLAKMLAHIEQPAPKCTKAPQFGRRLTATRT